VNNGVIKTGERSRILWSEKYNNYNPELFPQIILKKKREKPFKLSHKVVMGMYYRNSNRQPSVSNACSSVLNQIRVSIKQS
jgi:hypothetical protein